MVVKSGLLLQCATEKRNDNVSAASYNPVKHRRLFYANIEWSCK